MLSMLDNSQHDNEFCNFLAAHIAEILDDYTDTNIENLNALNSKTLQANLMSSILLSSQVQKDLKARVVESLLQKQQFYHHSPEFYIEL